LTSLRDPLTSNSPEIRPHINFHHIRDGTPLELSTSSADPQRMKRC
jgi:hypothetical protein